MHSRQRGHRLLVLRVPAEKMSREQRWEHARRQATYQDDERGNYSPGMRVQWELWKPYLSGEDLAGVGGADAMRGALASLKTRMFSYRAWKTRGLGFGGRTKARGCAATWPMNVLASGF